VDSSLDICDARDDQVCDLGLDHKPISREVRCEQPRPVQHRLHVHEGTRLAALLDVLGRRSDTTEIYTCEAKAHRMLHTHLDLDPASAYALLSAHGGHPIPMRR
jgi:hypothetical protein